MTRPDAPRDSRTPDPMHFERHAGTYGQARPPYPPQLWARLRDLGLLDPGLRAIDLGAGTGQATGPMLAAGLAVTAIEPGTNLAEALQVAHPGATVIIQPAEDLDLPQVPSISPSQQRPSTGWTSASCFPKCAAC